MIRVKKDPNVNNLAKGISCQKVETLEDVCFSVLIQCSQPGV